MATYVIGDIHGEYEKLVSCLQQVFFDYENDTLIQLGDVVDRGAKSFECVEELLKIKNLIAIKGNHDINFFNSYLAGLPNPLAREGGKQTYQSYRDNCQHKPHCPYFSMPDEHFMFFNTQKPYYIDQDNNLFIHGGFNRHHKLAEQSLNEFAWDRDLWMAALSYAGMKNTRYKFKTKDKFNKIFIGHTPTVYWGNTKPMQAVNIWNLDTGCGKGDYSLTIMNLNTEQYWQSK